MNSEIIEKDLNKLNTEKDCVQQIRNQIFIDDDGFYKIPQNLVLENYPEQVINSFLDFLSKSGNNKSTILMLIKTGRMEIKCGDFK
jgi:hypothetical protein